jgi:hypothetical protein
LVGSRKVNVHTDFFFFCSEAPAGCHPERSARHARVAKDLLSVGSRPKKQILRAFGAQDDKRVSLALKKK